MEQFINIKLLCRLICPFYDLTEEMEFIIGYELEFRVQQEFFFDNKIKNWLQIGKEENKTQKIEAPIDGTTLKPPIEELVITDGTPFFSEPSLSESVSGLKYNIRNLTDADIESELSQVVAKKLKEQQQAEQLKNIHEELKDWL